MDIHLNCQVIRSKKRRKTISLHIKEDGRIVIYAPLRTPNQEIERFIKEKELWVAKIKSENEKKLKEAEKTFRPGEKFLYLGEWYPLEILDGEKKEFPLKLSFGKFILHKDHAETVKNLFIHWYKKEARQTIEARINYFSHKHQLFLKGIKITSARSRWGSCSRDNRLSFSWRIIMAPLSVIDYILIHELVHIREKNHSGGFWNHLEAILPDYKKHRLWLKENGHLLML